MKSEEPMCYITYCVPARLLSGIAPLPFAEAMPVLPKEPQSLYPEGFMPEWFLRGSFPEDDFDED